MKKGTKAIIGLLCLGVVGLGICAYRYVTKGTLPPENRPTQEDQNNYENNKQKINKIVDKNPADIVIPEDTTAEQKVVLQEEKEYWAVNNKLKKICENSQLYPGCKSYKIDRLLYNPNNNSLLCYNQQYVEIEMQHNGKYSYTKYLIYPNIVEIKLNQSIDDFSLSNLGTILQNDTNYTSKTLSSFSAFESEDICNAVYNKDLSELMKRGAYLDGKDSEYIDSLVLSGGSQHTNIPNIVSYLVSTKENNEITYHIFEVDVTYYFKSTEEEMLAYIKDESTSDMSVIRTWTTGIKDFGFDWQELTDKYNDNFKTTEQSAEASASEFGQFDENGNMISFDYYIYTEKQNTSTTGSKNPIISNDKNNVYSQQM